MAKLFVKKSGALEQAIELGSEPLAIGRSADNDVVLLDPSVSRRHARIEPANGGYEIVDLESGNGLVHEGRRVPKLALVPGSRVEVGEFILEVEMEAGEPAVEAPRTKLVLIAGGERRAFPLASAETTVGRSADADVQLLDPLVSGKHFKIATRGGVHALVDLGSENGTYVNGVRVRERPLEQGDQIRVAGLTFYFAADGVEPAPGAVELIQPTLTPQAPRPAAPVGAPAPPLPPRGAVAPNGTKPEDVPRKVSRSVLAIAGLFTVFVLLIAFVVLRSPENSAEQEFQSVFQSNLSAEARERVGEYEELAADYEARGNLALALEQHRKILVLEPTHQTSLAETARLEEELERLSAEREAEERETRERLARVAELTEQSDGLVARNVFDEARALLEEARGLSPESDVVVSRLAAAYAAEGDYLRPRNTSRARAAYQSALELDPNHAGARAGIARIDQSQRASSQRQAQIEELTENGLTQLRREQFREAYRTFSQVLELDPSNERAAEFRTQASELLEQQVRPIYEEAVRLYNAEQIAEAMAEFQRALALHPDHAETRAFLGREMDKVRTEAVDRYKRAYIYEGLGRLREALELYRETVALLPDPREEYHQKANERIDELMRKLQ